MPNYYNQDPVSLDTAMTGGYKAAVASTQGSFIPLRVSKIVWHNPAAAGNTFQIADPTSGTVLFEAIAAVAGQDVVLDFNANPKVVRDFQLTQISSGTLLIYTR